MLIELLKHTDHNYNYFAASKLSSIIYLLKIQGQETSLEELRKELKNLKKPEFAYRLDEQIMNLIDNALRE